MSNHVSWILWIILFSWVSLMTVSYFHPSAMVAMLLFQWMLVLSDLVVGLRLEIRDPMMKTLAQILVLAFWGLSIFHGINLIQYFYYEKLLLRSAAEIIGALIIHTVLPYALGIWVNEYSYETFMEEVGILEFVDLTMQIFQNPRFMRSESKDEIWKLVKYIEFRRKSLSVSKFLYFCPYLIFVIVNFVYAWENFEFMTVFVFACALIVMPVVMFTACINRAVQWIDE